MLNVFTIIGIGTVAWLIAGGIIWIMKEIGKNKGELSKDWRIKK
jgi:hypothetical protein